MMPFTFFDGVSLRKFLVPQPFSVGGKNCCEVSREACKGRWDFFLEASSQLGACPTDGGLQGGIGFQDANLTMVSVSHEYTIGQRGAIRAIRKLGPD